MQKDVQMSVEKGMARPSSAGQKERMSEDERVQTEGTLWGLTWRFRAQNGEHERVCGEPYHHENVVAKVRGQFSVGPVRRY